MYYMINNYFPSTRWWHAVSIDDWKQFFKIFLKFLRKLVFKYNFIDWTSVSIYTKMYFSFKYFSLSSTDILIKFYIISFKYYICQFRVLHVISEFYICCFRVLHILFSCFTYVSFEFYKCHCRCCIFPRLMYDTPLCVTTGLCFICLHSINKTRWQRSEEIDQHSNILCTL